MSKISIVKLFFFWFFLLSIVQNVNSQEPVNIPIRDVAINTNIQSPNTASLGIYGNIPVSLYTGTPNVSVPIYQINEGNIPLDISLQYDASGVRVNSVPGWVGQNWSLQAGGVIQRSVKGRSADEHDVTRGNNDYTTLHPNFNNWGYMYDYSWAPNDPFWPFWNQGYKYNAPILASSNWSSSQNFQDIYLDSYYTNTKPSGDGDLAWDSNGKNAVALKKYQPDLEPDIFSFNFMGHTGKFFLGQDGQWKVASPSNFKVICDFNEDVVTPVTIPATIETHNKVTEFPRVINKITMIDDNGNQFVFGYNDATELTIPDFSSQHSLPIISSAWYLKHVKDKFGNVIYEFEYEKGPYMGHFYLNYSKFYIRYSMNYNSNLSIAGQLILPVYLKKIKTKSGLNIELNSSVANAMKFKENDNPSFALAYSYDEHHSDCGGYFYKRLLDFTTINPEWSASNDKLSLLKWKKLDNIIIKDINNNNLLTVDFNYINTPTRRLFLTNLSINTTKKYKFEYYNDDLLPNFLSSAIDHLGYFDGTPFILPQGEDWSGYFSQRITNPVTVKYGSLKKIIYPTKGYSEFEYEPHKYSKEIDKNGVLLNSATEGTIGGIRVKRVIDNDGLGNNHVKEYQYTTGINSNVSSGNLLYKPLYYVGDIYFLTFTAGSSPNYVVDINQLIPMSNLFSNTIEYTTVIEKESFFNSSLNITNSAYNIYKFSNYSEFPDLPPINTTVPDFAFRLPKIDKGFERGKLKEKSIYDGLNNLKERTTYIYQSNNDSKVNAISIYIVNASYCVFGACNFDPYNEKAMQAYHIYYTDKYLVEEKKETYSSTGVVQRIKRYGYKRYPETLGTIANGGDLFKVSEYAQSSDGGVLDTYKYPFDYSSNQIFSDMVNSRNFNVVSYKKEFAAGSPASYTPTVLISETNLEYSSINCVGGVAQVPVKLKLKKGDNSFETKFNNEVYDNEGNLIQYKIENGITVCLVWGYNKTKLIAKIENATCQQVVASLGVSNLNLINELNIAQINNLRLTLPDTMITTYTYGPLFGVESITDPSGKVKFYNYDSQGRLKNIKDDEHKIIEEYQYHFKN